MEKLFSPGIQSIVTLLKKRLSGYIAINCSVFVAILLVDGFIRDYAPSISNHTHSFVLLTVLIFSRPTEPDGSETNLKIVALPRWVDVLGLMVKALVIVGWLYYMALATFNFNWIIKF